MKRDTHVVSKDEAFELAYAVGFQAYREGRLEDSEKAFQQAVLFKPEDARAWEMLASTLGNLGQLDQAFRAFQTLAGLGHECPNCLLGYWHVCRQLSRIQDGIAALEKALQLHPRNATLWLDYGLYLGGFMKPAAVSLLPEKERRAKALESLEQAIRLQPSLHGAWLYKGILLYQMLQTLQTTTARQENAAKDNAMMVQKYFKEALKVFSTAAKLKPEHPAAWLHKGLLLVGVERSEEYDEQAQAAFLKVIRLVPELPDAWYHLATIYKRQASRQESLDALQKALALDPSLLHVALHDFKEWLAEPDVQKILKSQKP